MSTIKIPGFTAESALHISSQNHIQILNSFTDDIRAFVSLQYWPIPTPSGGVYHFNCCCANPGYTFCIDYECPIECDYRCDCNNGHPEYYCRCEGGGTGEPGPIIF